MKIKEAIGKAKNVNFIDGIVQYVYVNLAERNRAKFINSLESEIDILRDI